MADVSAAAVSSRFILRGSAAAGTSLMGLTIPAEPCRSAQAGSRAALWLGPDEWLLLAEGTNALPPQMPAIPHALVDISHRNLGFLLSGRDAATLLNGAVPLDLSLTAFPIGMCARTIFEKAEIVLWRRGEAEWHIDVARSFAPYVRDLLAVIASANGVTLTRPKKHSDARIVEHSSR